MFEYSFSNFHQILTGTRILNFKIIQILSVGCRLFKILRSQFSRKTKIILFIFVRGINLYLSNILCLINSSFFFFFFSFEEYASSVEVHSYILASMVDRDNNVRQDLGALYIYHLWTNVHENSSRIQHPSGTRLKRFFKYFLFINYIDDEDNLLLLLFQNGVLSGLPFICSYFSSVAFCYIADVLITRQILSLTNVRKVFTASCTYSLESTF